MLPLALDRLIICPVLNEQLGKEVFGSFVWVLGIMSLFGNIAANGFAILLMRNLAHSPLDAARLMMRTALLLSGVIGLVFCLIMFGCGFRVAAWLGKEREHSEHKQVGLPLFLGFLLYVAISFKMGSYAINYMGFIFLVLLVQLDQLRSEQQTRLQGQVTVPGPLPASADGSGALALR